MQKNNAPLSSETKELLRIIILISVLLGTYFFENSIIKQCGKAGVTIPIAIMLVLCGMGYIYTMVFTNVLIKIIIAVSTKNEKKTDDFVQEIIETLRSHDSSSLKSFYKLSGLICLMGILAIMYAGTTAKDLLQIIWLFEQIIVMYIYNYLKVTR